MGAYIIRRLLQGVLIIFIVTVIVFVGMRLLPGDPLLMLYPPNQIASYTPEQLQQIRVDNGMDKPMVVQYFNWLGGVVLHGDLGHSILNKVSVNTDIIKRLPVTAHLGVVAFILGLIIGIPAGIISAVRRGSWLDSLVTSLANLGITVPTFWLGIMMMYVFALKLKVLPPFGYTSPFDDLLVKYPAIDHAGVLPVHFPHCRKCPSGPFQHARSPQAGLHPHCLVKRLEGEVSNNSARPEE